MGLYEAIKDAAHVARKADNIELYQKVLELQSQALEMLGYDSQSCAPARLQERLVGMPQLQVYDRA